MTSELSRDELSEHLANELRPEKDQVAHYKSISKGIERQVHEVLKRGITDLYEKLSDQLKEPKVAQFLIESSNTINDLEAVKRFEIIHEHPMWNPENVTKRYMAFTRAETGESALGVSSFQAAGPGYSSAANRNRPEEMVVVPNFHRSKFEIKSDGELQTVVDITRSATSYKR